MDVRDLFAGWEETMVLSCLQGHMGVLTANHPRHPTAAAIHIGDFCFLSGVPDEALVREIHAPIIVPRARDWDALIEAVYGGRVRPHTRYATEKDPARLRPERLRSLSRPPAGCLLSPIDAPLYPRLRASRWSEDLTGQFQDAGDFCRRGLGVAAIREGEIVAGASSYAVCTGGIELEVDTRPDCRRQGLATACAARLILECLRRGLYPSWDAHTQASLALAEKLGYRLSDPYKTYIKV